MAASGNVFGSKTYVKMPITPLHLGPGVLVKSFAGEHLSLTMFALAQITMDLEVLLRLVLKSTHLHGFTNTIITQSNNNNEGENNFYILNEIRQSRSNIFIFLPSFSIQQQ